MPVPSSSTVSTPSASRTVTVPPGGLHLAALSSRLVTARSRPGRSPTTHQGSVSTSKATPGARRRTRATARSTTSARSTGSTDVGQRLVAGQLDQVADQRGQLLDLGAHVVEQLGAGLRRQPRRRLVGLGEQVEVGAQRGERGAQLVAGVGDQLALPVARGGQRGEHLVERRGQPGDLVVALDRQRVAGPRCGRSRSTAAVSRRTGRRPLRATAQPAMPAAITPARPKRSITDAELAEHVLLRLERLREHQRLRRCRRWARRRRGSASPSAVTVRTTGSSLARGDRDLGIAEVDAARSSVAARRTLPLGGDEGDPDVRGPEQPTTGVRSWSRRRARRTRRPSSARSSSDSSSVDCSCIRTVTYAPSATNATASADGDRGQQGDPAGQRPAVVPAALASPEPVDGHDSFST